MYGAIVVQNPTAILAIRIPEVLLFKYDRPIFS